MWLDVGGRREGERATELMDVSVQEEGGVRQRAGGLRLCLCVWTEYSTWPEHIFRHVIPTNFAFFTYIFYFFIHRRSPQTLRYGPLAVSPSLQSNASGWSLPFLISPSVPLSFSPQSTGHKFAATAAGTFLLSPAAMCGNCVRRPAPTGWRTLCPLRSA